MHIAWGSVSYITTAVLVLLFVAVLVAYWVRRRRRHR